MQLECLRLAQQLVLRIGGRLDAITAPHLDQQVWGQITATEPSVVLDLERLDYISSAGLRSLLDLAKRVESQGGKVAVCGLQGEVRKVFELSGFTRIFALCARPEA